MMMMMMIIMIMRMVVDDDDDNYDDDDDEYDDDDEHHSIRKILSLTMLRERTQRAWSIFTVPVANIVNIELSLNSIKSDQI